MLDPHLAPGDVVLIDNPAAQKVQGACQTIDVKGAELRFLPPYSPDLNPPTVS